MQAADLIARLKSHCSACKHVAGAADYANADKLLRNQYPAAFVVPLLESAGDNELASGVCQQVTQRFGVVLAVSNVRDAGGEAALLDLDLVRRAVKSALLGWTINEDNAPLTFAAGRLVDLSQSVLWWQDDFITHYYERA